MKHGCSAGYVDRLIMIRSECYDGWMYICGSSSISSRSNPDHCELNGLLEGLQGVLDHYELNALSFTDLVIGIDSKVLINWLYGNSFIKEDNVYIKLDKIYRLIKHFGIYNVNIHILWTNSHKDLNSIVGNDLADDLAKLGRLNIQRSLYWKDINYIYNSNDWVNFNYNSLKKETKSVILQKSADNWDIFKLNRIKKDSLSINLKLVSL